MTIMKPLPHFPAMFRAYCLLFVMAMPLPMLADAELALLRAAAPGDALELPVLAEALPDAPRLPWNSTVQADSPQYLISDDPEYIRVPEAVAMREEVAPGRVRLYVYNVNGVREPQQMPRRISAVIRNLGDGPLHVTMHRRAFMPPSTNYFGVAKQALAAFLTPLEQPELLHTIAPGDSVALDPDMEAAVVLYDELVHGFYEFEVDQPAVISVVQTAPDVSSAEASERIHEVLPTKSRSGAGRGKFLTSNMAISMPEGFVLDTAAGISQLVVADGQDDPWISGTESTVDEPAILKGNYGVLYDIEIPWTSSDGKGLAVVMYNARYGSPWCGGMAAAMVVNDGTHAGGVVRLPAQKLSTRSLPEVLVVQVYAPPAAGETSVIRMTYSPPGASCLPTPLVLVPVDWNP